MQMGSRRMVTTSGERYVLLPIQSERLQDMAAKMWSFSLKLGHDMATGKRCDSVYVARPVQLPGLVLTGRFAERRPLFAQVDDYVVLADPFTWVASAPMFMQLACLHHHYEELIRHVNTSLLQSTASWDALIWTHWIHRHGIHHMDKLLPRIPNV